MADTLTALQETSPGRLGVTGYRSGAFRIGPSWHEGHLLLLPDGVRAWPVDGAGGVTAASLKVFREVEPPAEILLVGLGAKAPLIAFELRRTLAAWGLSVEAMPTPSACRTFNLLLAEERRVVAALLAMP